MQQLAPWQQRHVVLRRQRARGVLEAEGAHLAAGGADEGDALALAGGGKLGIFAQEPVAGMNRLGAAVARRLQDAILAQVTVGRRGRADAHRDVSIAYMW